MDNFSPALQLTGISDLHTPSQACINPTQVEKSQKVSYPISLVTLCNVSIQKAKIELEDDGTYTEVDFEGHKKVLEPAKISLNDCLACR